MTPVVSVLLAPQHGDFAALRSAWVTADELGADRIYTWDHFFPVDGNAAGAHFEAFGLLGVMAEAVARAEIGVLALVPGLRNPNLVAHAARTLDHSSGGRFVLGLGGRATERDLAEYGFESVPDGLAEYTEAVLARMPLLRPQPLRRIPLVVSGDDEETIEVAARYADIWHGSTAAATDLDAPCRASGRTVARSTLITGGDPDGDVARGFTDLVVRIDGPEWDLAPLRDLLEWRDAR
jgi:alkanesulfonate monooxygenase SsuD/methylene tetrahydromethanopterin reductase-like flavin-dependent oxidoreductase (luciferase family)